MPSKGRRQSKISLKENNVVSVNLRDIAKSFCRFFSKLVGLPLQKLPRSNNRFGIKTTEKCYKQIRNECDNFILDYVDVLTVYKILKNLDVTKPSEIDQTSAKFLKDGAPVIAVHPGNIVNLPIKLDIFPLKWKTSKIKLLLKKRIKTEAKNYRHISLLPLISKLIEKSIYSQTQDYLQRKEYFYNYHSRFRANHSTDICLSWLTDIILNGAENRKHTSIILIDLQKAFDFLDHKVLLGKMKCIGFSNKTI